MRVKALPNEVRAMIYHEHWLGDLLIVGDENGHIYLFDISDPHWAKLFGERSHPKFE